MDVIHISMSNTKMGSVPSFSITPGKTCSTNARLSCYRKGCYAKRIVQRFPSVREAWAENEAIARRCDVSVARQINAWLTLWQPKAFRIHVGGDFFSVGYLAEWCAIAEANPNVKFFAFTKQFDVLREYLNRCGDIPKNLSIILSAWTPDSFSWCPPEDLLKKFPAAWVVGSARDERVVGDVRKELKRGKLIPCSGNCESCGKCFALKKRNGDVVFQKH